MKCESVSKGAWIYRRDLRLSRIKRFEKVATINILLRNSRDIIDYQPKSLVSPPLSHAVFSKFELKIAQHVLPCSIP